MLASSSSPAMAGSGQSEAMPSSPADASLAPPTVRVTWPEIVRLVDRHPALAASASAIDAARGGVDAAGAVPNPTVDASLDYGRDRIGGGSGLEWGLTLTIPLGWVAQRGSRVAAAKAEVDVTRAESQALRRDVLFQLRTSFFGLVYEQARVEALTTLAAQTADLVQTVKRRVDRGEARPVEATRVEIELERVTSELEAARLALSARQAALALWLGTPEGGTVVVAVADLAALPASPDGAAALAKVRATHPALVAAQARARALAAELEAEKMARVPSFSVAAFTTQDLDRRGYGVGLAVDLPLWNWSSGRIAQAEAKLAAGQQQAEADLLTLEMTVIEAQAACSASVATATRFMNDIVPRSVAAASAMEKTYQLGEASLLEVIDARRTLLEARRLFLSALAQAQIDCSRLSALTGEEPQ